MKQLCIITGANRGLGLELAKSLLARPAVQLCLVSRKPFELPHHDSSTKDRVSFVNLDVTDDKAITMLNQKVRELISSHGTTSVTLVNNAGVFPQEFNKIAFDNGVNTNVNALVKLSLELMDTLKSHSGRIINVSSTYGNANLLPHSIKQKLASRTWSLDDLTHLTFDNFKDEQESLGKVDVSVYKLTKCLVNYATALMSSHEVPTVAVDPGWCQTDMGGERAPRTAAQGIDTMAWLIDQSDWSEYNGKVMHDRKIVDWGVQM